MQLSYRQSFKLCYQNYISLRNIFHVIVIMYSVTISNYEIDNYPCNFVLKHKLSNYEVIHVNIYLHVIS